MSDVVRRLAAILSADVVGYTRLMADDELATLRTLTDHRTALADHVGRHGGRVVDTPGDNLLAEFPSVREAVACAVEAQRELAARDEALPESRRMPFRIGIHLGEVLAEGERIYGDGVNIAARLEAVGEAGGLCLSGAAFDQVEGKLPLRFEDLGTRTLKNVPRPVRLYRWAGGPGGATPRKAAEPSVPGFAGRPAVAVMPFHNLSADPEQEYFADGIAEDLLTRLSSFRWFPVIARNSSFSYKGRAVGVKQVGEELGARYVVEGSVRKAGERVRVTAQLIDARSGHQLWAERYDRRLEDIFDVQDEVAGTIATAVCPELRRADSRRSLRARPESLDAWDCFMQGMWYMERVVARAQRADNQKARELLEAAVAIDPRFAPAFFGLAINHIQDAFNHWGDSPDASIAKALEAASRAVALDDRDAFAHHGLGVALLFSGDAERALTACQRAIELDPSLAIANWSFGLACAHRGRAREARESIERALRLSPRDPLAPLFWSTLGLLHFDAGRYEQAAQCGRNLLQIDPSHARGMRLLAAALAELGELEEGRRVFEASRALGDGPDTLAIERSATMLSLGAGFARRMTDALRKVGWEGPAPGSGA
jgi:adenylate cyclase